MNERAVRQMKRVCFQHIIQWSKYVFVSCVSRVVCMFDVFVQTGISELKRMLLEENLQLVHSACEGSVSKFDCVTSQHVISWLTKPDSGQHFELKTHSTMQTVIQCMQYSNQCSHSVELIMCGGEKCK